MKDIDLLKEVIEKEEKYLQTMLSKEKLGKIFLDTSLLVIEENGDSDRIFEKIISEYLGSVRAISKLSPGLSTGISDIRNGISIRTYSGKVSDDITAEGITEDVVFDVASMTKMFTAILLLKEEERGNIDLNMNFNQLSPLLGNIDIPVIDALKFASELRTLGRLDEEDLSPQERVERFKGVFIYDRYTYRYSDIPYMLVPLIFGKDMEDATENYLKKFYQLYRDELGLDQTGYSTIDMTGGIFEDGIKEFQLFDPKARLFEREVGYVPAHAGVTTTVKDLEKLFTALNNGFLSKESIKRLITTIYPDDKFLLDENGNLVMRNNNPIKVNHAFGVYPHIGDVTFSDVGDGYSEEAFAAAGSTGSYAIFDIKNGLFASFLPNIKSGLYNKRINTDNYSYGVDGEMPTQFDTVVIAGTKTMRDGRLIREDGTEMPYTRATNNFKEYQFEILFKLRLVKKFLIKKALQDGKSLDQIDDLFKQNIYLKKGKQLVLTNNCLD